MEYLTDIGRKPSQVILVVFFTSKIAKIIQHRCSHCPMASDGALRWLSTVLSHGHRIELSLSGYTPSVSVTYKVILQP